MYIRMSILLLGLQGFGGAASLAEEISPGVSINPPAFDAPINELPFYGFREKTPVQLAADERFIADIRAAGSSREAGAAHFATLGWHLLKDRRPADAARRFNQAWLLDPGASDAVHGMAIMVQMRFNDLAYADQLFRAAARLRAPGRNLAADHGRILLIAGRYNEARPPLERAVAENPDWAVPKSNLAWTAFHAGDVALACKLAATAAGREFESVKGDLAALKQQARCP